MDDSGVSLFLETPILLILVLPHGIHETPHGIHETPHGIHETPHGIHETVLLKDEIPSRSLT